MSRFRTLAIIAVAPAALAGGLALGLSNGASAESPKTVVSVESKTPTSCLLALESAWKTINQTPPGIDHKAEFDASYATCLQES